MNSYTWAITATGKLQNTTATDPRSHLVSKLEVRVVQQRSALLGEREREGGRREREEEQSERRTEKEGGREMRRGEGK